MAWLLFRDRLGSTNALFAGLFLAAGLASLAVGVLLIPFSLFGLVVLIGIFGFTPLLTSVIFFRNGVRALRAGDSSLDRKKLVYGAIIGALWCLVLPLALYAEVNRSIELVDSGDFETLRAQETKLRILSPLVDHYQLKQIYWKQQDGSLRRDEIAALYFRLTGHDIEDWQN
jgi:hypothetical protein